MSETPEDPLPTGAYEDLGRLKASDRYIKNRDRYRLTHGQTLEDEYRSVIEAIETIVGPMLDWQRFWIYAAISGRGVEWTQTRGRSHYHIVGVPCSICGRGGSLGVYRD